MILQSPEESSVMQDDYADDPLKEKKEEKKEEGASE